MRTKPGDIVLIHYQNNPSGFARVEEITGDVKPGWWQIHLLFLSIPLAEVTWILREEYIDGDQFTMGGQAVRLERLPEPKSLAPPPVAPPTGPGETQGGPEGKVVSLGNRRRKN